MTKLFTVCSQQTPEMFAEYREPEELPPGPAFIQGAWPGQKRYELCQWAKDNGYVWQDATDHSPAGWVRPKHRANRTTGSGDARRQNPGRTMKEG